VGSKHSHCRTFESREVVEQGDGNPKMSARYVLEKVKFGIYVFFPIGIFYYFNRPEFYEQEIV